MPLRLCVYCLMSVLLSVMAPLSFASATSFQTSTPPALAKWLPWVEAKHPTLACTPTHNFADRICAWPSPLQLQLNDQGGQFEQQWWVQQPSVITLVGDALHWPHSVTLNGQAAHVVESQDHTPQLHLAAGQYTLKGQLSWQAMPQRLAIANSIGMVNLTVNGQKSPAQIKAGNVWLQKTEAEPATERDTQSIEIFRFIKDGIPLEITTVMQLKITGNARELHTGALVLPNTITQALSSELPAKIEADGSVRLRVRSGEWTVTHTARVLGMQDDFTLVKNNDYWPHQEVWAFKAATPLRQVKIEGPHVLDETQLELPDYYHDNAGYTLYLMEPEVHFTVVERLRGQQNTQRDTLNLKRDLWLDFNGEHFTFKDTLNGQYQSQARINILPALILQSASIDDEPQIITQYAEQTGLEVRKPNLALAAMGRINTATVLPINGWQSTLEHATVNIHLPPGFKAWHLGGADTVNNTWLSQWDLWSIFITLLIAGSLFKLCGSLWGITALITSALTYQTPQSIFLWLAPFCLLLPLLQRLPVGRFLTGVRLVAGALFFMVALQTLGFGVQQFRVVLYPQLDVMHEYQDANNVLERVSESKRQAKSSMAYESSDALEEVIVTGVRASALRPSVNELDQKINSNEFSQTGPAEPSWHWQTVTAHWQGSVLPEQTFSLIYSPPWLTRALQLLGIFASFCLVGLMGWQLFKNPLRQALPIKNMASSALLFLCIAVLPLALPVTSQAYAASYPPEFLLKELEAKAIKAPACAPHCGAINRVTVEGDATHLTVTLIVTAAADYAFALPIAGQWQLEQVLIDNEPVKEILRKNTQLLVPLKEGSHVITLNTTATSNNVNIDFNGPAYNVTLNTEQWQARGAENGQLAQGGLALARKVEQATQEQWNSPTIEPFVSVEREIHWNLNWTVSTTVTRVAPTTGPISLQIPLLPGENLLTEGMVVNNQTVAITLNDGQDEVEWESQLQVQNPLRLNYGDGKHWAERWALNYAARWHLEASGTPSLFNFDDEPLVWLPRPHESLQLVASRPEPITGPKVTVLSSDHSVQQGKRLLAHRTQITLNASVGGDYLITLPADAQKIKVLLNDEDIHVEQEDKTLTLALVPGENAIDIQWQAANDGVFLTQIPSVQLETPNNNSDVTILLNQDRWPLWVWGPRLGPAMLYWGVFLVLLLSAAGLRVLCARFALSIPVSMAAWLLLGFGVSTLNTVAGLIVALWFFMLEARKRYYTRLSDAQFNAAQVVVVIYTVIALGTLIAAIPMSLLSLPDMQVVGNNSSNYSYHWYTDHTAGQLPQAGVMHVSIWVFRLAMLAWSLWLVFALLRWAKWFWLCVNEGGFWKKIEKPTRTKIPNAENPLRK